MTHERYSIRYIYAAYDKATGEFKGYWAKGTAFSPIALTPSVWDAEFISSIKIGQEVREALNRIDAITGKPFTWKLKAVTISAPKDVE